ncbi:Sjogrens syndrome scleroderma autoantigen 1 [Methanocaldococcus infernus ME]|uniref:Sjogrens syndrome scleroderma autoantigen 1 n=1 Tax=Methanocaldococcus infernus (strain DSM 11812 / JCM 15783 / ME) TaxID=573063 RepID=D5VTS6_METIM|nr:Sjogren's syndrome/scleroderma autoantigen 1 family protein [Methanocaldococcus infernus]ADG13979.1 Sjogrens syndrome scleroderma autoantigen 1 [Methanocaldococcus infernus ME]
MEKNIKVVSAELLKGAKMLSKHCKNCGFPLFEKNGVIYCPICSKNKEKEEKKFTSVPENGYKKIIDSKINYLFNKLKNEDDVHNIREICETILILMKLKSMR